MACVADLAKLETEREFYEALPPLIKEFGPEEVRSSMKSFLTRAQINECFKRLAARESHIVWMHCSMSAAGALGEITLVITDQSLNEVDRKTWVLVAEHRQACSDSIMNGFLQVHCAPGCRVASATASARHLQVLARELPAVRRYVGEPIDLSYGGVRFYAELLSLPVIASDGDIAAFEERMRVGDAPNAAAPLAPKARGEDHCEMAILALGWTRERFIAPPKAARYVTFALHALSVFLVGSLMRAAALWVTVS